MPKILAIVDNKNNLVTIRSAITDAIPDCTVLACNSAEAGIKMAKKELPDTILLDIKIDQTDGFEVCKRLKSNKITKRIPVIMLTAEQADSSGVTMDLNTGVDAFLAKPIVVPELIPLVKSMLRLKKAEDALNKEKESLDYLVTKREKKLQESEIFFSQMFEQSSTSTCLYDPKGYMVSVNPEFCKMFGVEKEEITDGRYNVFKDQAASDAGLLPLLKDVFENKRIGTWETQFNIDVASQSTGTNTSRSGQIHLEVFGSPILDPKGNLKYVALQHYDISERKKVEDALRESEEKYRVLFESSRDAILVLDPEKGYLDCNQATLKMFGHASKDALLGLSPISLSPGHQPDGSISAVKAKDHIDKTLENGSGFWEWTHMRANGIEFPSTVLSTKLMWDQRTILQGTIRDITESKKVEKALLDSEKKYRDVVQFAIEAICVIQDSRFKFFNPEAVKLFGYSEDELRELPSEKTIYPDDRELVTSSRIKRLAGDYILGIYSHRILTKDGSVLWVEIRAVSIDWDQQPAALVFLTDITERKKVESALTESNERYVALFDRLQDSVYINDFEGNFIDANPAALKILGYSKEEIQATSFASLMDAQHLEMAYGALREIVETGTQKKPTQLKVKKKDGDFIWMESTGALINQDGRPHAVQGIARDITQSREVENQLKLAKERAEVASLTKSQFLTNISHELRTPMQGILGFASLGVQRIDELSKAKFLDYFQEIYASGHRLMTLINGLLDLSKLESGKTEYEYTLENISLIVATVISEFKAITKEKEIDIVFQKPKSNVHLKIDKDKIFQVVRNLLFNAVKFSSPKSKIKIEIVKKNQYLKTSIIDSGVGIPEDELESVFDKFTQSSKTKSGAGGTGLGLAICLEIVKAHQGKIWAENNPAGGATFSFVLPCQ